ncbi:hypothetical protein [Phocaeicola coprophilus]|uniref:hypothetical protein n=1 Tax=Phocaeicola coprophilus TaxID=387090 RepID=UPI00255C70DC|nr:hypothetical protein [Phocaeicola coprophilus]
MKKLGRYLGAIGLLLLIGVATSCIKDDIATTETGTANITVNISSRSGEVDNDNSEVLANEDIKTIRLILVQNGKVVSNSKHSFTVPDGQKLLEQGIRIVGVNKAATDFYAVVNEANVNKNFESDFKVGTTFDGPAFSQVQLIAYSSFNSANGLPMVGCETKPSLSDGDEVMIKVTRAVARIDLTINNKTGADLGVSKVSFGKFFPTNGFLLAQSDASVTYTTKTFDESNTIENAKSDVFTYYLYESCSDEEGVYKVGLNESPEFPLTQIYDAVSKAPIKEIKRNTILKINAIANASGWELQCEVAPWDVEEYNQEFSNTLVYSSDGWKPGTIAARDENVIQLIPDMEAELQFMLESPNTVSWVAVLDDNQNFTLLTPEGKNEDIFGVDADGKPIAYQQSIKISLPPDGERNVQTTLHVYAIVGGNQYEIDLTDNRDHTGPGEGEVNRFIIRRGDQ